MTFFDQTIDKHRQNDSNSTPDRKKFLELIGSIRARPRLGTRAAHVRPEIVT
jgi:hypothetical protein